ncbi:MAG: lipoyl domain-containing protein [Polyangiaceae bacterium]
MIYELRLQAVDDVEEVRVLAWHRAEGDPVESGEMIVEVETSKAIIELRSANRCFLRKISVDRGDWARVGASLGVFSDTRDEELLTDGARDLAATFEVT